jgi:hypothetical protein
MITQIRMNLINGMALEYWRMLSLSTRSSLNYYITQTDGLDTLK